MRLVQGLRARVCDEIGIIQSKMLVEEERVLLATTACMLQFTIQCL